MKLPPDEIYSNYPLGIRFNLLLYYEDPSGDYISDVLPYYEESKKTLDIIVDRNLKGKELESQGRTDEAIVVYEQNILDFADTSAPYDRLRIIYTKRKQYDDAMRVCQAYINMSNELGLAILKEFNNKKLAKQLSEKGKFPEWIKKLKQLKAKS